MSRKVYLSLGYAQYNLRVNDLVDFGQASQVWGSIFPIELSVGPKLAPQILLAGPQAIKLRPLYEQDLLNTAPHASGATYRNSKACLERFISL